MEFLAQLWLPILLSAVFVFIVSSVIHMATPMHKGDYKKMQNEDAVLEALRTNGVAPGMYMFPCACSMKEMNSPEMVEKRKRGPVGWLCIQPGGFNMGRSLALWFVFCLIVGVFTGYVAWHALGPGVPYLRVFRIAGTAAILGYAVGYFQDSVWKGAKWSTTAKFIFDGVIYGLVTAGTFGWLWPQAV
jgi:uncharacterized membrane protein YraQ (UPF0718 family)